jgi:hypothetical protein
VAPERVKSFFVCGQYINFVHLLAQGILLSMHTSTLKLLLFKLQYILDCAVGVIKGIVLFLYNTVNDFVQAKKTSCR